MIQIVLAIVLTSQFPWLPGPFIGPLPQQNRQMEYVDYGHQMIINGWSNYTVRIDGEPAFAFDGGEIHRLYTDAFNTGYVPHLYRTAWGEVRIDPRSKAFHPELEQGHPFYEYHLPPCLRANVDQRMLQGTSFNEILDEPWVWGESNTPYMVR